MNTELSEKSIIDRLKAKITGLAVEPFPDKPEDYKLTHPKGSLLVRYTGSTYDKMRATDVIVQDQMALFDIVVVFRGLRHGGLYTVLDAVRIATTGFKPADCGKMRPVRDGFISEVAGVWQHGITFATPTVNIEVPEEEQAPLLTRITALDDQLNQTTEVP